jgi:uncharacterized repeat protein (TIGR01451 family)
MLRRLLAGAIVASAFAASASTPAPAAAATGPDLTVAKDAGGASTVAVGDTITYRITARNDGTSQASNVVVRDPNIDPQLQYVAGSLTSSPSRPCTFRRSNLVCSVGKMNPGGQFQVRITLQAVEAACPRVINRATVRADNESSANTTNNTSAPVSISISGCPPDTTPPTGSLSVNGGAGIAYGPRVMLGLTAIDRGTPLDKMIMRISNSGQLSSGVLQFATNEAFAASRGWSLTSPSTGGSGGTGVKTVYVQFRDNSGNWSAVFQDSIRMTRDAPNSCSAVRPTERRATGTWQWEQIYPRGDSDWFKYRLGSRRSVSVLLASLPANYRLELFTSRCVRLAASNNRGTTSETITRTLSAGTYFVRVSPTSTTIARIDTYAVRMRLN